MVKSVQYLLKKHHADLNKVIFYTYNLSWVGDGFCWTRWIITSEFFVLRPSFQSPRKQRIRKEILMIVLQHFSCLCCAWALREDTQDPFLAGSSRPEIRPAQTGHVYRVARRSLPASDWKQDCTRCLRPSEKPHPAGTVRSQPIKLISILTAGQNRTQAKDTDVRVSCSRRTRVSEVSGQGIRNRGHVAGRQRGLASLARR